MGMVELFDDSWLEAVVVRRSETLRRTYFHLHATANEETLLDAIGLDQFEEIWQYGTNETEEERCKQDGIAPQCPMHSSITFSPIAGSSRGRIPIDPDAPHDFLGSHYISNYTWIFTKLIGKSGDVKGR